MARTARILLVLVAGMGLAACADDMSDLEQEVEEIKQRPGGEIDPLPTFEPYAISTYDPQALRDPFIPARAYAEAQEQEEDPESDIAPDRDRPREPLEQYPLDGLQMVGTLSRDNQLWGLIRDPRGTVHHVLEGNYAGQNHGEITRIREDRIEMVEIVRDDDEQWTEQEASLGLGEER